MQQIFLERYRGTRGGAARTRFLAATLLDVLGNAALERAEAARRLGTRAPVVLRAPRAPRAPRSESRIMTWQSIGMDLRYGLRQFVRAPLFTGLTMLALALGIGANSAIFSVVNGVLLRPLPYAEPDQLVMIWSDNIREGRPEYPMAPANFLDYRASARATRGSEAMFSFLVGGALGTREGTEQLTASVVTAGMFELLGRSAAVGRTIASTDRGGVVVLSDGYWARRFGRDRSIVGRQVVLNQRPATIVGVMPPDFVFPYKGMLGPSGFVVAQTPDIWTVLDPSDPESRFADAAGRPQRGVHYLSVLARLVPGSTAVLAQQEALAIANRLEASFPESNTGLRANVVTVHEQAVGQVRPALVLLLAGVGVVLLMACVNVANLLLAQSVARQKEMAVRAALGARKTRLLQQVLVESLLLALCGAAIGLLGLRWGIEGLLALAPGDLPRLNEVTADWRVLAFTGLVALATGICVGVVPGLASAQGDVQSTLKEVGRGVSGGVGRRRARAALVVAQMALAVLLTIGAGLFVRSFVKLLDVDPGFTSDELLTLQMTLPERIAAPAARLAFYRDLFARLESLPGVRLVGGTTRLPLGSTNVTTRVAVEGRGLGPGDMPEVEFRRAMHDYFKAMGIPVLRGRSFAETDTADAAPVVVINETMARRLWPAEDPLGKRVRMNAGPNTAWNTVVGVVGDIRHAGLDEEPAPEMYISYLQGPPVAPFIVIRTAGDPAAMAESVRAQLKTLDKDLVVYDLRTMTQIRSASVAQQRFMTLLASAFGAMSLLIAAIGVYGVMALVVTERTREMGIRLALGAEPLRVVGLVVRQGLVLAALGLALGVTTSLMLTPMIAGQLYGVGAYDPTTLAFVSALLTGVALLASAVPARRAMRVDPVMTLRQE
jgi:putative ABC transport system permease protein